MQRAVLPWKLARRKVMLLRPPKHTSDCAAVDTLTCVAVADSNTAALSPHIVSKQSRLPTAHAPVSVHCTPVKLCLNGASMGCAAALITPPEQAKCADASPGVCPRPFKCNWQRAVLVTTTPCCNSSSKTNRYECVHLRAPDIAVRKLKLRYEVVQCSCVSYIESEGYGSCRFESRMPSVVLVAGVGRAYILDTC